MTKDRIKELAGQKRVTGIDFIYVYPDQVTLDVYFLTTLVLVTPLPGSLKPGEIIIYSPETGLPPIAVDQILSWRNVNSQDVVQLKTKQPGDFTLYRFKIDDSRIDPYYNDISFSFKANCPSDLDCRVPDHECPPDEIVDFPIDYMARDFWSYRKALLDFASLRYPDWNDRLEADAGVMMVEVMSALGDEMSYYQDRISREAYLETATQRRSIRRHARLVDYQMHDGLGAKAWLDINVNAGSIAIPAGTNISVLGDNTEKIDFEIGKGIMESVANKNYTVRASSNSFQPHIWDEDEICLKVGTTELYLKNHCAAFLAFDDLPEDRPPGKWVLLQTIPLDPAQPERTQLVRLVKVTNTTDPVFVKNITHIEWEQQQALRFEFDLTVLVVRGNIVPATAGKTHVDYFIVDKPPSSLLPAVGTVNRYGNDDSAIHLFTLPGSQTNPLVYLGNDPRLYNTPEIILEEVDFVGGSNPWAPKFPPVRWEYRKALVGITSSGSEEGHFTLDDGSWQRVVGYQRIGIEIEHPDYAMNAGVSLRFGNNKFGKTPEKGTAFMVRYRLGGTRRSNVASGTIKHFETPLPGITVINPLPATGGWDPETATELRQLAPEAFRAVTFRAVRPEDYAEAAERLPWVQKAGAVFRWTGSWLTAFVTPDPRGKTFLDDIDRTKLLAQLNLFRQAGREVYVMDPEYANMDLEIHICVDSDAYPGEVKQRVFEALFGKKGIRPKAGYFSPDRFTFATFLERPALEAAIQAVPGVRAVEQIYFRRRGWFTWRKFTEFSYDPGKNVIIRIENDPLHPGRGTLKLYTHGGL